MRRETQPRISREAALGARPRRLPARGVAGDGDRGELRVTMEHLRPRWQQWMGAPSRCERTYVLDALGREVYEACDGARRVRDLVESFAQRHRVSAAEAEYSVTAYLRTLMSKGLVATVADREAP